MEVKMNAMQKFGMKILGFDTKKVGNQVPLVDTYYDGRPILQEYDLIHAVEHEMKQNPFLYTALRRKADAIASVPFFVEELRDGVWGRIENHPAEYMIENANPFMSGFELKKFLVYHKELAGSAFWQVVMVDGKPQFFQPLFPQHTVPVRSRSNFIGGFEYRIDGKLIKNFKSNEVFWTKYTHPSDPYQGLSPLSAIAGELQTDIEARKWNKVSLSQRGAADAVFIMKDIQSEAEYELARRMVDDKFIGPDNGRRPWIIGGNSDVRPMSYTALEMDFVDTRKFNREVIAAAIGVPAPLIGDADNSTYNNLDTLKRVFWEDTVLVFLEELRQDLTRQVLIPHWGDARRRNPTIRFMYDVSNVEALQQNMKEKVDIAKVLFDMGFSHEQINNRLELSMDMKLASKPLGAGVTSVENEESAWIREISNDLSLKFSSGIEPEALPGIIVAMHTALCEEFGTKANLVLANKRGVMMQKLVEGLIESEDGLYAYDMLSKDLAPRIASVEVKEANARSRA